MKAGTRHGVGEHVDVCGGGAFDVIVRVGMDKDRFVRFPGQTHDYAKRLFANDGSSRARCG